MQANLSDGSAVIVAPSFGSLDDFDTETAPEPLLDVTPAGHPTTRPPTSLSRGESRQARHRRQSRLRRLATIVRNRFVKKPVGTPNVTVHGPESDRVIVATLLSIVAVTYGSFLTAAWRQPVEARAASAPTSLQSAAAVPATLEPERAVARQGTGGVSASTLTALWKQHDTRSLDQAFAGLRRETLAFRRCGMRQTADDRAVASCEGEGSTWTIDFQRAAGRWQIANVSTR